MVFTMFQCRKRWTMPSYLLLLANSPIRLISFSVGSSEACYEVAPCRHVTTEYVHWLQRKNTDGILDTQTDNAIYSEMFILWGFVSRRVGSPAIDNTSFNRIHLTCYLLILFQSHFAKFVTGLSKPWRKEAVPTVEKRRTILRLLETSNSGRGKESILSKKELWNEILNSASKHFFLSWLRFSLSLFKLLQEN